MNLRHYQQEAHTAIFKEWQECRSTLVVKPTGTGKTVLFAAVMQSVAPKRSLMIAHREELIWQARERIESMTNLTCEIEMADMVASGSFFTRADVMISTVQTQCAGRNGSRRMHRFDPNDFGLLVIDEAHHATSKTYRDVINYYSQNASLKILGVTATPDRADEQALGQVFETVAYDYEILDAIRDGWLVPIEQQMVKIEGLDFSDVRTTAGDLNGADLAAILEAEKNLQGFAGSSLDIIGQRRAIVFTASVLQAETMCNIFNRHRKDCAAWVCASTPKDERRVMLRDFASGKTQIVVNCGILTEGFDDAGVEVIIMARPTKSRSLYSQMAGRSTRPIAGLVDGIPTAEERRAAIRESAKPSCLIVDFVGNSGKHKLMTTADILGGKVSDEAIERAVAKAKAEAKPVRMDELLDRSEQELREEVERRKKQEEARKSKVVAKVKYQFKYVDPFDLFDITPAKERGWDFGKQLSVGQKEVMRKYVGVDPGRLPYAHAKQILIAHFQRRENGLCSPAQAKVLRNMPVDCRTLSKTDASMLISLMAQNNWQPVPVPEHLRKKNGN